MITISVNNEAKSIHTDCSLSQALKQWHYSDVKVAVAINGEFVPRTDYGQRFFQADDCIDIVAPIQGG